jgi:hypothetical protein
MKHSRFRSLYPLIVSLFIICLFPIIMVLSASADQLYKWTDENGMPHISTQPPDKPVDMKEKPSIKTKQNKNQLKSPIERIAEAEIRKIEADHLRVVDEANKKFLEEKRRAEENLRKEIEAIDLNERKTLKELEKMKRDILNGKL